jgi:hypothetical protein
MPIDNDITKWLTVGGYVAAAGLRAVSVRLAIVVTQAAIDGSGHPNHFTASARFAVARRIVEASGTGFL